MNKKIGIVLSGGGAKGAFEVGVLKVLLKKIENDGDSLAGISGTSIGALNAAFVASGQFDELEKIWLSWDKENCPLTQTKWYGSILSLAVNGALFRSEPVFEFLEKNLDVQKLLLSPTRYINTAVRLGDGEMRYGGNYYHNTDPTVTLKEIQASMAFIPGTLPVFFKDNFYVDGGFRDTVPVKGLIENCDKLDFVYVINVNKKDRVWNSKLLQDNFLSLISKFDFAFNDILWDENNRSDIEIGRMKYWNHETYRVVYPETVNLSTTDFDTKLILESYYHGIDIAQQFLIDN